MKADLIIVGCGSAQRVERRRLDRLRLFLVVSGHLAAPAHLRAKTSQQRECAEVLVSSCLLDRRHVQAFVECTTSRARVASRTGRRCACSL